jgi:AcrR family transcriptional regulator
MARRQRLLDATSVLVAERGFHAVGILEIGAAAGVSGSAIYRHFANKDELLVALLDQVVNELLAGASEVRATETDPDRALEELVDRHVEFALRDRAVIRVYDQEAHNLPPGHRTRLRTNQREYAEVWIDTLLAVRTTLTRHRAGLAVHAVFGLINSVSDHDPGDSTLEVAGALRAMALAALMASEVR